MVNVVHIRAATTDDANHIRAIYAPFVAGTAVTFDLELPSLDYFREKLTTLLPQFPVLVAEADGGVVGFSYASSHNPRPAYRWTVEVSIYLAETHHRRGIGRQLYQHLLSLLQRQGMRIALAGITLPNAASVALHESFGFQQVALLPNVGYKLNAWRDVGWWSLDLATSLTEPPEPTPFSQLPSDDC